MSGPRNSPLATTNPSSRAFRSRRGARHAARAVEWSLLAAGLLLLVGLLGAWQSLLRVDHLVQDATTGLQKRPPHPDIVVVAIDERSIAAIGRWPWRRVLHAELLRQISLQEPQAIGMDILFTEEDTVNPVDDTLLANAIRSSGRADAESIPIIALTANAFWEDAERVKREGMNEHLPKPLDVGKMLSVLAKYRK